MPRHLRFRLFGCGLRGHDERAIADFVERPRRAQDTGVVQEAVADDRDRPRTHHLSRARYASTRREPSSAQLNAASAARTRARSARVAALARALRRTHAIATGSAGSTSSRFRVRESDARPQAACWPRWAPRRRRTRRACLEGSGGSCRTWTRRAHPDVGLAGVGEQIIQCNAGDVVDAGLSRPPPREREQSDSVRLLGRPEEREVGFRDLSHGANEVLASALGCGRALMEDQRLTHRSDSLSETAVGLLLARSASAQKLRTTTGRRVQAVHDLGAGRRSHRSLS